MISLLLFFAPPAPVPPVEEYDVLAAVSPVRGKLHTVVPSRMGMPYLPKDVEKGAPAEDFITLRDAKNRFVVIVDKNLPQLVEMQRQREFLDLMTGASTVTTWDKIPPLYQVLLGDISGWPADPAQTKVGVCFSPSLVVERPGGGERSVPLDFLPSPALIEDLKGTAVGLDGVSRPGKNLDDLSIDPYDSVVWRWCPPHLMEAGGRLLGDFLALEQKKLNDEFLAKARGLPGMRPFFEGPTTGKLKDLPPHLRSLLHKEFARGDLGGRVDMTRMAQMMASEQKFRLEFSVRLTVIRWDPKLKEINVCGHWSSHSFRVGP
jgi:hypothetical protein